jgi:hypothetical protein
MWTWCGKEFRHGGQNKVAIETTYIPHACVFEFLQGEQGDMQIVVEWNISKICPLGKM